MNITIKTITPKLTISLIKQIQEATMAEMQYAIEKGKVLGYINSPNTEKRRVFLILNEAEDYRIVTNYDWKNSSSNCRVLFRYTDKGLTCKKTFSTEHAKIEFLELFSTIKKVALMAHIYI